MSHESQTGTAPSEFDRLFVAGKHSTVLHVSPDCPMAKQANYVRSVDPAVYPSRGLCRRCDPAVTVDMTPGGRTDCVCGGVKGPDGTCDWCARFEAVMG